MKTKKLVCRSRLQSTFSYVKIIFLIRKLSNESSNPFEGIQRSLVDHLEHATTTTITAAVASTAATAVITVSTTITTAKTAAAKAPTTITTATAAEAFFHCHDG